MYERFYLPSDRQHHSHCASPTGKAKVLFLFVRGCNSYCVTVSAKANLCTAAQYNTATLPVTDRWRGATHQKQSFICSFTHSSLILFHAIQYLVLRTANKVEYSRAPRSTAAWSAPCSKKIRHYVPSKRQVPPAQPHRRRSSVYKLTCSPIDMNNSVQHVALSYMEC